MRFVTSHPIIYSQRKRARYSAKQEVKDPTIVCIIEINTYGYFVSNGSPVLDFCKIGGRKLKDLLAVLPLLVVY